MFVPASGLCRKELKILIVPAFSRVSINAFFSQSKQVVAIPIYKFSIFHRVSEVQIALQHYFTVCQVEGSADPCVTFSIRLEVSSS